MNRIALLGVALLVSLAAVAFAAPAIAAPGYALSASPAVDTPTRSVTIEGETFAVSSIARVAPGDEFSVAVTAPEGDQTTVLLYDERRNVVDFERATGTDTVRFATADAHGPYDPGSYLLVLSHEGDYVAAQPLVLPAYDVEVDAPETVEPGATVRLSATVEPAAAAEPIQRVTAVIGDDEHVRQVDLRRTDEGSYRGATTLDGLPSGDYSVYVAVRGQDRVNGQSELIGVSDAHPIRLEGDSTTSQGDDETATTTTVAPTTTAGTTTTTAPSTTTTSDVITPEAAAGNPDAPSTRGSTPTASPAGFDLSLLVIPGLAVLLLLLWFRR